MPKILRKKVVSTKFIDRGNNTAFHFNFFVWRFAFFFCCCNLFYNCSYKPHKRSVPEVLDGLTLNEITKKFYFRWLWKRKRKELFYYNKMKIRSRRYTFGSFNSILFSVFFAFVFVFLWYWHSENVIDLISLFCVIISLLMVFGCFLFCFWCEHLPVIFVSFYLVFILFPVVFTWNTRHS